MAKLTLLDLAKRSGNEPTIGIVESLSQLNAFFTLAPVKPIDGSMYKYQQRASLPTVGFRDLNGGVTPQKSVIRDVVVECKDMLGVSEVDKSLADRAKEGAVAFRQKEDAGFLSAMANTFNSKAYYGNSASTAAEIDGVGRVLSSLGGTCVSATGSSANVQSSMYFWSFSDAIGVSGRVPGVEIPIANGQLPSALDLGVQMAFQTGSTTAKYPVYTTIFEFKPGLAIYDSRSVGRLCNIDSTHLPTIALINQVITAMMPYQCDLITCSKTVYNYVQALKGTTGFDQNPQTGLEIFKRARFFDGIPILVDESITQTEAVVS